jgi:hypothetical protein
MGFLPKSKVVIPDRRAFRAIAWSVPLITLGILPAAELPSQIPTPTAKAQDVAPPDPLIALNDASRAAYRRAKEAALTRTGPVILVEGDDLVLKRGDRRIETRFAPDLFHVLKAVSHIPLALDVMLASLPDGGRLDEGLLGELRGYRGLIESARGRIARLGLERGPAERQARIFDASLDFIDSVIDDRACERNDRIAFLRRMSPLILANAAEAARAQLDSLHRLVSTWREGMPVAEWERLTVVIMGRQLPRKDNLAVRYFSGLLGEPGEGRRIVYAESLFDEPEALDLLATHLVDTQVGLDFFDDPTRMHRDLLGDAAKDYLPHLLGRPDRAAGDRER